MESNLQEFESNNKDAYITIKVEEDTTKILEEEIFKKVELSLNIDEVKS